MTNEAHKAGIEAAARAYYMNDEFCPNLRTIEAFHRAFRAYLGASRQVLVPREPIAWRWRFDAEGAWSYADVKPGRFRFMEPVEIEPLYAAAPKPFEGE